MLIHHLSSNRVSANDRAGRIVPDVHDLEPAVELLAPHEHNATDGRIRVKGNVEIGVLG
jgi:hypothetical protein